MGPLRADADVLGGFVRLTRGEDGHAWAWAGAVGPAIGTIALRDHELAFPRRGHEVRGDGIWLDRKGSPLSEGATMVERITRPTYGRMRVQITITDLKAYTAPFTVTLNEFIVLDKELIDFVCLENNKDEAHLVGM